MEQRTSNRLLRLSCTRLCCTHYPHYTLKVVKMCRKLFMQILLINWQLIFVRGMKNSPLPLVETKFGFVYGEEINNLYVAYRGIPFAEVPRGALRFEAPQALSSNWSTSLNARSIPNKCLQWQETAEMCTLQGSEDCLYLNIFVPLTNQTSLMPVLVFIHGGGFMWGSSDFYGEQYIMQQRAIILVTMNYRLGVFGFLSTEDEQIAGNMGLKDQSMALQWIHENIAYFGGDTQHTLLSGWSAGGASVSYHMVSDMTSANWFTSAASFSGSGLCACHAIYAGEALKLARELTVFLNVSHSENLTSQRVKSVLQNEQALNIMMQVPKFYKFLKHPFIIFQPVIENNTHGSNFLKSNLYTLLRTQQAKRKPYLLTHTAEDGAFGAAEFLLTDEHKAPLLSTLDEKWQELALILLFFNKTEDLETQKERAMLIRQKYFGNEKIERATYKSLAKLLNDELSVAHMHEMAELYANFTKQSQTYGYVYDNEPAIGLGQIIAQNTTLKFGTVHGDDIFLIFHTEVRSNSHPLSAREQLISQELIKMLISLAKTGQPIYNGTKLAVLNAANNYQFDKITRLGLESAITHF